MKIRMVVVVVVAAFAAVALPALARAGTFAGTVIAKQPQRGTLVLAGARGAGLMVHASSRARVGDRVTALGSLLRDGTLRARQVRVIAHARSATIRGVVVRQLHRSTLLATGNSVITIRDRAARRVAAISEDRFQPGTIAEFRVRFEDDDLIEEQQVALLGQAATIRIEGVIVSVSPLVVSTEHLPLTIAVPAGVTLPATLAPGQRIEVVARVDPDNVFTLVAIDEIENVQQAVAPNQEVRVRGLVVGSSATQVVVSSGGAMFTFAAPTGVMLPVLPAGTPVEVRGVTVNGVLTAERLKVEDEANEPGDGRDGDGDHGGHDGGGGDHGGNDDGGGHDGGGGGH
jgi:uncharacterized membrane protein YgcG